MAIYTKKRLEKCIEQGEIADWKAKRYTTFRETMTDGEQPFPCYFAVEAQEQGSIRYTFPESSTDEESLDRLADDIEEFVDIYENIGKYPSLVIMFRPPEQDQPAEVYKNRFWNVLEHLQKVDPEPWPATVPTDPKHPKWQYCFAGEPLFLLARAPFYEARRSRYAPYGLEIDIQPQNTFDDLTGFDDTGQKARTLIKERQAAYDDIERHPDILDHIDPRERQWKKFMLPETNEESLVRYPLSERTDVEGRTHDQG